MCHVCAALIGPIGKIDDCRSTPSVNLEYLGAVQNLHVSTNDLVDSIVPVNKPLHSEIDWV